MRLELVQPTQESAQALLDAVSEGYDHLTPWMNWAQPEYHNLEDMMCWLEMRSGKPDRRWYFIYKKDNLLGAIGFFEISERHLSAKLGYWLRQSAVGQGYVSEALRLIEDDVFSADGLNKLIIDPEADNLASVHFAERNGYVLDGVLREDWYNLSRQKFSNVRLYSKLKSDWEKDRGRSE